MTISPFAQAMESQDKKPDGKKTAKITFSHSEKKIPKKSAYIIITDGTFFVPSNGTVYAGGSYHIEPICSAPLRLKESLQLVEKVLDEPKKILSWEQVDLLIEAKDTEQDALLRVTKSKSNRSLERTAAFYSIQSIRDNMTWVLFLHNPKSKKKLDPNLILEFPISTPIEKLVKIILEDVKKYPHALRYKK